MAHLTRIWDPLRRRSSSSHLRFGARQLRATRQSIIEVLEGKGLCNIRVQTSLENWSFGLGHRHLVDLSRG